MSELAACVAISDVKSDFPQSPLYIAALEHGCWPDGNIRKISEIYHHAQDLYTNFDLKYTDSTTLRTDRISINKNQSRDQLKTSYRHTNTFHHNKQASINIPHIFLQRLLIFVD